MPRPLPFAAAARRTNAAYEALHRVEINSPRPSPRSPSLRLARCCSSRPRSEESQDVPQERASPPQVTKEISAIVEDAVKPKGDGKLEMQRTRTTPLLDWNFSEKKKQQPTTWIARLVIIPDHKSRWVILWDLTIVFGLFVVAVYEPYALALLDFYLEPGWCVIFNRFLDTIFTVDMGLHFFMAYRRPGVRLRDELWETDPALLAKRYCGVPFSEGGLGGWFWFDLLAVMPGWYLSFYNGIHWGKRFSHEYAGKTINGMLLLRIFRLFLLTRVTRLYKLIELWHAQWGFHYYLVDCVKFVIITSLTCHWMACIWCMVEGKITRGTISNVNEESTWLTALIESKGDCCLPNAGQNPGCVYMLAYYWATTTLTSVGYGDITPQNKIEYCSAVVCMTIIAYVWAYIVGCIVSILSNVDPHTVAFKRNVDCMNELMTTHGLPQELRVKLRTYMNKSREFSRLTEHRELMQRIVSRGLQLEVAAKSPEVQSILRDVFWVKDLQETAILEIVRALHPTSYGPGETMNLPETMIVIHKGMAGAYGKIISRGHVWGSCDLLLETPHLKDMRMPITITYVEIFMLTKKSLIEVCKSFPLADQRIRRAQIRTAVWRNFVRKAAKTARLQQAEDIIDSLSRRALPRGASGAGSFVVPGMSLKDVPEIALVQPEAEVPPSELKNLLLQLMHSNDRSAREINERFDTLENRIEDVWQQIQDYPTSVKSPPDRSPTVALSAARVAGTASRALFTAATAATRIVPRRGSIQMDRGSETTIEGA